MYLSTNPGVASIAAVAPLFMPAAADVAADLVPSAIVDAAVVAPLAIEDAAEEALLAIVEVVCPECDSSSSFLIFATTGFVAAFAGSPLCC